MEVILSLAILAGAVAITGELSRASLENARVVRDRTKAQLRCESKMAEIAAGLEPLESQEGLPFEDETDWTYSIMTEMIDEAGLMQLTVTVMQGGEEIEPVDFSLVRWIIDPSMASSDVTSEGTDSASSLGF